MEIKKLKVNQIIPYDNNPRKNDEAVKYVKESIKQCGYITPIIVDEDMVVLAGHTRLKAIKELGWDEVEVKVQSGLTDEQKKKYRILDNKTSEFAEWDMDALAEELDGLDFEGFDFGFDLDDEEPEKERDEVDIKDNIYQIIIDCDNEYDQEEKFNRIQECGIECRLSTL